MAIDGVVLEQAGLSQTDLEDRRDEVIRCSYELIDRFVRSEALADVYCAYGETSYDGTDRAGALAYAEDFGNRYLDWRQGTPRRRNAPALPPPQEKALIALGEATGMTGESNAHNLAIDIALVQGSYKESVYRRTQLAAEQHEAQTRLFPDKSLTIVGLGIDRPLTAEDHASKIDYAREAQSEFDLVNGAFEHFFGAHRPVQRQYFHDAFGVAYSASPGIESTYVLSDGGTVTTLKAPKVKGLRFANTEDTHNFAVQALGAENLLGATILGTTTQVYEPFQRADMLRVWGLPFGIQVEMAGYQDPEWTQPAHIGQELNSFFDQGTRLLQAIELEQAKRKGE